jgi:predicted ribosomally synthesized peptide with SipW-like signal peptide
MNRKILVGILAIGLVALAVGWGTYSQFSDTETSVTTFSAGSLDLTINDKNGETVTFSWNNLRPGDQPHYSLTLKNIGTIPGYLDISNIVVVSGENGLTEPEIEAGDTSANEGELDDVLNIRLFLDYDHNGWISDGDKMIYNGLVKDLPSSFMNINELVPANGGVDFVVELYDWWTHGGLDNQAQTDTLEITFTFLLSQNP